MRNNNFKVEEDDSFTLTRERFINLCLDNLKKRGTVKQLQDDFHYEVDFGDGKSTSIYLGNAWQNYERSKDPGVVSGFIDVQIEIFDHMNQMAKGIDPEKVYPVFRQVGFDTTSGRFPDSKEVRTMRDSFSKALEVLYVQDHPKFVSFVVESQLPKGYTPDTMADKAFENLKKQGWVEPIHKLPLGPATVYMFHESNKQYQGQFMVREMYEKNLGDYFFLALPTRDDAIAVVWHDEPDNHLDFGAHIAMTMKQQAVDMFEKGENPLTPILHRITAGEVKLLG